MATLRERLAEGVPLVAVSLGDDDAQRDAARVRDLGVDVAELRVDWYSSFEPGYVRGQVAMFRGLPTLATVRSKTDGGYWPGTEPERLRLYEALLPEVDAIDVELSAAEILPGVVDAAKAQDKLVVVSHHDFAGTPSADRLAGIAEGARAAGADLVKVSTMAHDAGDLRVLTAFTLQYQSMGLIVIAMGAQGAASRVFFPLLGSRITYSALGDGELHAPGQLPFSETARLLGTFSPAFAERRRD
jgi:3-dehydroquinate dehydratase-1